MRMERDWTVHDGNAFAQHIAEQRRARARPHPGSGKKDWRKRAQDWAWAPGNDPTAAASSDRSSWEAVEVNGLGARGQQWSVHDGKMFANAVRTGVGRAPNERRLLHGASPTDVALAELLERWSDGWGASRREAERDAAAQAVRYLPPSALAPAARAAGDCMLPPLSMAELASPERASRIDDYELLRPLGLGQFAIVWRVRRRDSGEVLALKLTRRPVALASTLAAPGDQPLRADGRADCPRAPEISPMDAECFRLEVTALLAISGKGATSYSITGSGSGSIIRGRGSGGSIVGPPLEPLYRAHGFAAEAGGLRGFVVMGLIEGQHMLRLLRASPPLRTVASLLRDVAAEVEALHARGLVHRDIKETNIVVREEQPGQPRQPRARLVDFGLSVRLEGLGAEGGEHAGEGGGAAAAVRTTFQAEQRVGVYEYMSPEVFHCRPFGAGVDTYAFGVLLYRALKAAQPLPPLAQLWSYLAEAPFAWTGADCFFARFATPALSPHWPAALSELVSRCTKPDEEERPSMRQVRARLDEWLAAQPPSASPASPASCRTKECGHSTRIV
mmetsp:Transcript_14102/g.45915  ORF Transcript_14102/g.45915 Transcript_14102/m.45915 type:complete len:561 (-) Transcript_14102:140-1822(-)